MRLLPWFALQMETHRGGGGVMEKKGKARAALLAQAEGRGERTYFALVSFFIVVSALFPGNKLKLL